MTESFFSNLTFSPIISYWYIFSFIILVSNCSQNQKISSLSTPYDSKNYQNIKNKNYQKMVFTPYNFQKIIHQEISLKPLLVKNISNKESVAALATIYLVCMTKEVLDLLDSKNTIVIDGGFANNMYYMELLKELCSTQKIYCNKRAEGTSLGAATIAFENINGCRFDNPCKEIIGKTSNKMKQYYTKWKSLVC